MAFICNPWLEGKFLERLICARFLQGFKISCALLRMKRVREKRGIFQKPVKIVHMTDMPVVLFSQTVVV